MPNMLADFDVRDGLDHAIIRKLNNNFHFLLGGGYSASGAFGGSTSPITSSSVEPEDRTDEVLWYNEDEGILYIWSNTVDPETQEPVQAWVPVDIVSIRQDINRLNESVASIGETVTDLGNRVTELEKEQGILWQGASVLAAGEEATLAEPVSDQLNGIVLVFSLYDHAASEPVDDGWHVEFVPKLYTVLPRKTTIDMHTHDFAYIGSKCVTIGDTSIQGGNENILAGTQSGITYDNFRWCLRYVYGI